MQVAHLHVLDELCACASWVDSSEAVREGLDAAGLDLSMGAPLARLPKGFEDQAGSPLADDLKRRHLIVSRPIAPERLRQVELIDDIVDLSTAAQPLLTFGWSALDRARGPA